jgi:hypothetical protein
MRYAARRAVIRAAAMNGDDHEYEHSPLSGTFSRDGESVSVEIYRYAGTQDPWRLGVIDLSSGGSTVWQETYATDQEAYDAFTAMVDASGLAPFVGRRPEALN